MNSVTVKGTEERDKVRVKLRQNPTKEDKRILVIG